jgi:hypothetical protein
MVSISSKGMVGKDLQKASILKAKQKSCVRENV